jgi:hypothetical protein
MALHNHVESVEQRADGRVYAVVVFYTDDGTTKQRGEFIVNPPTVDTLVQLVATRQAAIAAHFVDPSGIKALVQTVGTELQAPVVVETSADPSALFFQASGVLAQLTQAALSGAKVDAGDLAAAQSAVDGAYQSYAPVLLGRIADVTSALAGASPAVTAAPLKAQALS